MASKLYGYGPDGNILDESDRAGNVTDRFGWFNGEMVARLDTSGNVLHYLYHDHLGWVFGAYAGAGAQGTFGNAGGAGAMRSTTTTVFFNLGLGLILDIGVAFSYGNGTWQFQVTPPGPSAGVGASIGVINTTTNASSTGGCS